MAFEKPAQKMHQCKGCDRQIPEWATFCLFCRSRLNKLKLCLKCGQEPRDTSFSTCAKCRHEAFENRRESTAVPDVEEHKVRFRDLNAKEKIYETKFGG